MTGLSHDIAGGNWVMFDADTGERIGFASSSLGCVRQLDRMWSSDSWTATDLDGHGEVEVGRAKEDPFLATYDFGTKGPAAVFCLPRSHPSITVVTSLARQEAT